MRKYGYSDEDVCEVFWIAIVCHSSSQIARKDRSVGEIGSIAVLADFSDMVTKQRPIMADEFESDLSQDSMLKRFLARDVVGQTEMQIKSAPLHLGHMIC